jgi:hypothetical protein
VRLLLEAGAHEATSTTYSSTPLSVAKGEAVKELLNRRAQTRSADMAAESARLRALHVEMERTAVPTAEPVCDDAAGDKPHRLETLSADDASHTIRVDAGAAEPSERVQRMTRAEAAEAKRAAAVRRAEQDFGSSAHFGAPSENDDEEEL